MIVEIECISQLPIKETGRSIARYVPMQVFQKKMFVVENLQIEEHIDYKGLIKSKYTTCKYDGEFYKLNKPYKELRDSYFTPVVIKGLGK